MREGQDAAAQAGSYMHLSDDEISALCGYHISCGCAFTAALDSCDDRMRYPANTRRAKSFCSTSVEPTPR